MHNVLLKRQATMFTPDHATRAYIYKEKEKISMYKKTRLERLLKLFHIQTLIIHKNTNSLVKPYFTQTFIMVRMPT